MSSITGNIVTPVQPAQVKEPAGLSFDSAPNQTKTVTVDYKSLETSRSVKLIVSVISSENVIDPTIKFSNGTNTIVLAPGETAQATIAFTTGDTDGPFAVNFDSINEVVA